MHLVEKHDETTHCGSNEYVIYFEYKHAMRGKKEYGYS